MTKLIPKQFNTLLAGFTYIKNSEFDLSDYYIFIKCKGVTVNVFPVTKIDKIKPYISMTMKLNNVLVKEETTLFKVISMEVL